MRKLREPDVRLGARPVSGSEARLERHEQRNVEPDEIEPAEDRLRNVLGEHDPPASDQRDLFTDSFVHQPPVALENHVAEEASPSPTRLVRHELDHADSGADHLEQVALGRDADPPDRVGQIPANAIEALPIPAFEEDQPWNPAQTFQAGSVRGGYERGQMRARPDAERV